LDVPLDAESLGRPLTSGVYFLRVKGGSRAATGRIILAR